MKTSVISKLLLATNIVLAGLLAWRLFTHELADFGSASSRTGQQVQSVIAPAGSTLEPQITSLGTEPESNTQQTHPAAAVFTMVYSTDTKQFAENLRAIGCPDQTVRDIITAEVHRRFKAEEEALRPKPADHVPFAWSATTTEPKLVERRGQAAALARQEASLLREALGCEATVPIAIYAQTRSDQQFEAQLTASPGLDSCSIRQVHDTYWADVQVLMQRTKGFWLPEDVAELQALKAQRQHLLRGLLPE